MLVLFPLNVCPPSPSIITLTLKGSSAGVKGSDTGTWHGLSMGCSGPGTRYPVYSQNKHQKLLVPPALFRWLSESEPLVSSQLYTPLSHYIPSPWSRRRQSWHVAQAGHIPGQWGRVSHDPGQFQSSYSSLFWDYTNVYIPFISDV